MNRLRQLRFASCALLGAPLLALGCDFDSPVSIPAFGTLSVMTVSTGTNIDPDGYQLMVNGPSLNVARSIGANDSALFSIATGGDYTVELQDIAANCTTGTNPRVSPVLAGGQAEERFLISCN